MAGQQGNAFPRIHIDIDDMDVNKPRRYTKPKDWIGPLLYLPYACLLFDACAAILNSEHMNFTLKVGIVVLMVFLFLLNVCHFIQAMTAKRVKIPAYYSFASLDWLPENVKNSVLRNPAARQREIWELQKTIYETYNEYIALKSSGNAAAYCRYCEIVQPPRTFHCDWCQRCVYRMESHSWLLGRCLDYRNTKYAVHRAVYDIVILGFIVMIQTQRVWMEVEGKLTSSGSTLYLIWFLVIDLLVLVAIYFDIRYLDHARTSVLTCTTLFERRHENLFRSFRANTLGENVNLSFGSKFWWLPIDGTDPDRAIHEKFRRKREVAIEMPQSGDEAEGQGGSGLQVVVASPDRQLIAEGGSQQRQEQDELNRAALQLDATEGDGVRFRKSLRDAQRKKQFETNQRALEEMIQHDYVLHREDQIKFNERMHGGARRRESSADDADRTPQVRNLPISPQKRARSPLRHGRSPTRRGVSPSGLRRRNLRLPTWTDQSNGDDGASTSLPFDVNAGALTPSQSDATGRASASDLPDPNAGAVTPSQSDATAGASASSPPDADAGAMASIEPSRHVTFANPIADYRRNSNSAFPSLQPQRFAQNRWWRKTNLSLSENPLGFDLRVFGKKKHGADNEDDDDEDET